MQEVETGRAEGNAKQVIGEKIAKHGQSKRFFDMRTARVELAGHGRGPKKRFYFATQSQLPSSTWREELQWAGTEGGLKSQNCQCRGSKK